MSGIVGIWNRDGTPAESSLLGRLSGTLAHRGPDGQGIWISKSVGVAARLLRVTPESAREVQPLAASNGPVLVWDGRLDNRAELLEQLDEPLRISLESPDPELVLAAYNQFGGDFAGRIMGDFALAVFDPANQELILARDGLGIRPLYYTWAGETFLFASEIKALLAHPGVHFKPNQDMLAEMILQAPTWGNWEQTFFEGIQRLPRGHLAIVTPENFTLRKYWDFDPHHRTRFASVEEYAEAFRHHFTRAVQRRLRSSSPVAIGVSGGLDSSSIFCVADRIHKSDPLHYAPLRGFHQTYKPGSPADEESYIRDIEESTGQSVDRFPHIQGFMEGVEREVLHTESPLLNFAWNSAVKLMAEVKQRGCRTLLTGGWGDVVLFQHTYVADLFRRFRWRTAWRHTNEFHAWNLDCRASVFRRESLEQALRYLLPGFLVSAMRKLRGAQNVRFCGRHAAWYNDDFRRRAHFVSTRPKSLNGFPSVYTKDLYDRLTSRYYQFLLEWANKSAALSEVELAFPFLDRDLLTYMMSIPGEMHCPNGIPKGILRLGLRGVVPSSILERRWKADFTEDTRDGIQRDIDQVRELFLNESAAVESGFVDRIRALRGLNELSGQLQESLPIYTWSTIYLAGLETWLRLFRPSRYTPPEHKEEYNYV